MKKTLLISILLILSPHSFSNENPVTCQSKNIVVTGEVKYGRMVTENGQRVMQKVRKLYPIGDEFHIHSNDWKGVYLQVPPERRSEAKSWQVKVTSHADADPTGSKVDAIYELEKLSEGYFPLADSEFVKMLPNRNNFYPGVLIFDVRSNGGSVCQHSVKLVQVGD